MRMDKLTTRLQMALADAQSIAVGRDHQYVEPVHVMQALLDQDGGSIRPLLQKADVNAVLLRSEIGKALDRLPRVEGTAGEVLISNDLGRLLNVADKLAQQHGDAYISSELFLLAASQDQGELGRLLRAAGASRSLIEQAVELASTDYDLRKKYDFRSIEIVRDYQQPTHNVWGIQARNREQNYALNLLMNPDIDFVTLVGMAGSG